MVFRVEHQSYSQLNAPRSEAPARQSNQSFASELDAASVGDLVGALAKRGIDTSGLEIPAANNRQIPIAAQGSSQVLATPFAPSTAPAGVTSSAASATAAEAPFVPEFQQNLEVTSLYGGSSPLNPFNFATPATAQWIAQKYGTGQVTERPYEGQGGPFSADGNEYWITLKNGAQVNAGILASYYQLAPEAQFPGVADAMIRNQLTSQYGAGAV